MYVKVKVKVTESCPALGDFTDWTLPNRLLCKGILQARILDWVAIPFFRACFSIFLGYSLGLKWLDNMVGICILFHILSLTKLYTHYNFFTFTIIYSEIQLIVV